MDNQTARTSLIDFCKRQASWLPEPLTQEPRIGLLKRFFDDAPNFTEMLSEQIWEHLQRLPQAQKCNTLALWSYNLAAYIQEWLMGPLMREFSLDIRECLGDSFIAKSKQALKTMTLPPHMCEASLCKGMASRILQDLLKNQVCTDKTDETIRQIQVYLEEVQYTSQEDIDALRINALRDQLMVDKFNSEHGAFWERQTTLGLFRFGGKKIQPNLTESFKVPDTVYALMEQSNQVLLNYEHYRQNLTYQKELHSQHYHILRKPLTRAFYQQDNLEYTHVATLRPNS